ncbi:MAG: DUF3090 domain-containing protein [Acidimicrobiia bacterium]|jgi:uncharacterized repeat protein (TIGR03847 family)|nr:DUF3090 domain-containing protein [Acidimicrobiia bacterium]MDQ3391779.1 DUF3090 family protein [Actinomycetota bacterium]
MGIYYEFDEVDVFTTGTQGDPGQRVFFLQARTSGQRITVRCEKQQVAAIAMYLRRVLTDLPPPEQRPLPGALELTEPDDPVFVLGPIGLGYDRSNDRLLVQLEEFVPTEEDDETDADDDLDRGHLRLFITRSQADAFCEHAERVIESGRPSCIWCALPIDPDGHACPRMN